MASGGPFVGSDSDLLIQKASIRLDGQAVFERTALRRIQQRGG